MSASIDSATKIDTLYLKFFRMAVLGLMSLALLAIIILLPMAAFQYFQTPAPPAPAKAAPERAITVDDLKKFLIDEEKRRKEMEKNGGAPAANQPVTSQEITQRYAEQELAIYRCAEEFRVLAQQATDTSPPAEIARRREDYRSGIEQLAANKYRGAKWATEMANFVCVVLKNPEIAKLKQEGEIGPVVRPAINFHARLWAEIAKEKEAFLQAEEQRIASEIAAEESRVAKAKAMATLYAGVAGGAALLFLFLALYLIFARIESNLAMIHKEMETFPRSIAS